MTAHNASGIDFDWNSWSHGHGRVRANAILALQKLAEDFHAGPALGDEDLFSRIWARDAVFQGGPNLFVGREAIVNFFTSGPRWGKQASASPVYKGRDFKIRGNRAEFQFECVVVHVPAGSPVTDSLVGKEIVQHSTASITAVKRWGKWRIQTFNGAQGPIQ